jgi:hypothetical protein
VVIGQQYSKGLQKTSIELMYTTCEVAISSNLPDIFLQSKKQNYPDIFWNVDFTGMEVVDVSESFDRNFTVHAASGKKTEVLSLLTPAFTEKLIEYAADFHVEINNERFFVHCSGYDHSPKKLKAMNTLAEYLIGQIK